jgi:predicted metal-dependent HD superfamily phosphohydrolase
VEAFAQLAAAYSEPHRRYHNLKHIGYILKELRSLRGILKEPAPVEFAAWYHDAVYDSSSKENEKRSAEAARYDLKGLGLSEQRVSRVCELILFTKTHQAPENDTDAHLFLDLDLGILGAPRRVYTEYSEAIRKEYDRFSDRDYYLGRRAILQGFLQRPMIYHSEVYRKWYEDRARANLAAEIAQIDEILRMLPS